MITQLRLFVFTCLIATLLLCSHAGAAVVNKASASFALPAGGTGTVVSNTVRAQQTDSITYFTSAAFTTVARATRANGQLFVQISAADCNLDPSRAEEISVTIASKKTGDRQAYMATETGPDTGTYRITPMAMDRASDEDGHENDMGDGMIEVMPDDTLTASIAGCGSGEISTDILVDPIGVVYDSVSNEPIAGATVTLIDVTGAGNGGNPGGPAIVFDVDGETRVPSTVVTDELGMYHFPLVAPSLYRLKVIPPSNYGFPSKTEPGKLPAGRETNLYGSYGGEFTVSAALGVVTIDVPLDPIQGTLYLQKNASRAVVEVGEVLDYTIRVFNAADDTMTGVVVTDTLPAGFSYVPGSMRLDDAPYDDRFANRGPRLDIAIGDLAARSNRVLRYRVRIGAGALQGDGINRAQATSVLPVLTSTVAAAKVKVEAGIFSSKGHILGTVFADCNANGLRDADEPGVPDVRIWLEDGNFAQTDAEGRYSFAGVTPVTHVAKVDATTLPAGTSLAILSNRNAGDAGSRFVDLKDGELARADFALDACGDDLRAAIATRAERLRAELQAAAVITAPANSVVVAHDEELDLSKLDNQLAFIGLEDGAVLPHGQATVRIKGSAGSQFTFTVNGALIDDSHVGQQSTVADRQLDVYEYVGVALRPGRNELDVLQKDAFGNARGSQRITVVVPGKLARLRIKPQTESAPADGKRLVMVNVALEDADGVPVVERTPVTLDASSGEWDFPDLDPREPGHQVFVEGGNADFSLRAPKEAGEARLLAASSLLQAKGALRFVPDLRPLVAAGVVEGSTSLNRVRGNTANPLRDFDGFEDKLRHLVGKDDGLAGGARAAMFAKGQVGENTLVTMAYDSDKDTEPKMFRDIDPLAYYPTYGDNARRGFEAQSTSRLYLRAERDRSYVMYGDFVPPGVTPQRNLGAYNRNLTGLRTHAEVGGLTFESFASYDSTRQMIEEIAANGTSGPFLTGGGLMVINSERVEIVVRDRNQTGLMLSRRLLARYADYDIDPLTGRILLRAPVASLDQDLNPISLRISYEVDQGHPRFWVGGIAAQYKIGEIVEVGGSAVEDRNPAAPTRLVSVNASVTPDDKTVVTVEAAQMEKFEAKGRAARIDATRTDGALESRVFAGRADANFDNPSSSLPKGRTEGGATVRYRVTDRATLGLEALHTADIATDAERNGVQLFGGYTFENGVQVELGVRRSIESAGDSVVLAQPDLTSVRAKVATQIPGLPQAGVFLEGEQDIHDNGRRMVAVGGDYRFAGGSRVYGRHELISSLGSTYALNQGQQRSATVFGVDSDYMQDGRVFTEYRAGGTSPAGTLLGERQAEAALGLRNLWTLGEGVRANTSVERVKVISGAKDNEAIALTGAIEVSRHPTWTGNARLELRHGEDSDGVLSTLGLAYKINDSLSFLGKNTLAATKSNAAGTIRLTELLQSGVAYRALESIGVTGLAKYEYKLERDDGPANLKRAVHAVSMNANWQLRRDTVVSGRYAAKVALDRSSGLSSRTVSHLVAGRVTHEINEDWDVGATGQVLLDRDTRGRQYAAGVEAGYQLQRNMWVSAGYNFKGFTERDLAGADATAKGVYFRMRMKFDENTLQGLLNGDLLK
ncbi:SdrD B-like domain-containing protein [Telluria beijingensis]|uniref:SdrD B-like domain-containing protein n=1 Tax=Telluria beijingensis TaxID=3068633 RepID=UPI002795D316|nr:SdrD B-like domain-containing protein [Massilia sp. REN29]